MVTLRVSLHRSHYTTLHVLQLVMENNVALNVIARHAPHFPHVSLPNLVASQILVYGLRQCVHDTPLAKVLGRSHCAKVSNKNDAGNVREASECGYQPTEEWQIGLCIDSDPSSFAFSLLRVKRCAAALN
jgi:hypothetical protein